MFSDATFWKVSELVPQADDLVGCSLGSTNGSMDNIGAEHTQVYEGCYLFYNTVMVVNDTSATIEGTSLEAPSTGVYFFSMDGGYITSLTYGSITVHSLDPKFLPEGGFGWEESGLTTLLPETTVVIAEGGDDYVKLSSTFDVLTVGQTYTVFLNGAEYECVARAGDGYTGIGNGTISDEVGDGDEGNGEPFYIDSYDDGEIYLNAAAGEYTISITGEEIIVHQIDEKFIPGSGDGGIFVITLTFADKIESEEFTGQEFTGIVSDRTTDEIVAAYDAGRQLVVRLGSENYPEDGYSYYWFSGYSAGLGYFFDGSYEVNSDYIYSIDFAELEEDGSWYVWTEFHDKLPPVTTENNGAFLRVVDGSYALVNLTDVSTEGA